MQLRDYNTDETIGYAGLALVEDCAKQDKTVAYFDGVDWESIHPDDAHIYRSFQYDVREVYVCSGVSSVFARAGQWLISKVSQ